MNRSTLCRHTWDRWTVASFWVNPNCTLNVPGCRQTCELADSCADCGLEALWVRECPACSAIEIWRGPGDEPPHPSPHARPSAEFSPRSPAGAVNALPW